MRELIPEPPDNPPCFVCSDKNPDGLKLKFYREGDSVVTDFTPRESWTGWGKILHGGFQSLVLDEITSWCYAALGRGTAFVTSELKVSFKRPVHVGQTLTVRGTVLSEGEGTVTSRGEILSSDGVLLSEALATLKLVDRDRFEAIAGSPPTTGRGAKP